MKKEEEIVPEADEDIEIEEEVDEDPPSRFMGDLFLGVFLIAVCIWAAGESVGMPRRGALGIITSPGFTPLLVSIIVTVLSGILVVKALKGGAVGETRTRLLTMMRSPGTHRVLILSLIMIGYVALIGVLDFRLVTGLYLLGTFIYVRAGGWIGITIATVVGTALTTMIIPDLFTMPTP